MPSKGVPYRQRHFRVDEQFEPQSRESTSTPPEISAEGVLSFRQMLEPPDLIYRNKVEAAHVHNPSHVLLQQPASGQPLSLYSAVRTDQSRQHRTVTPTADVPCSRLRAAIAVPHQSCDQAH